MIDAEQQNQQPADRPRYSDSVGVEAALRRAAKLARQRAFETIGAVVAFEDGKVVWEKPDGTFVDDIENILRPAAGSHDETGEIWVAAVIRNPAEPHLTWEGLFLVGTGSVDSVVPRPSLEAIGLAPKGRRVYGAADGSEVTMDITTGDIEFMGEVVGATIIMGETNAEPLLGATALESAGIGVDQRNLTLKSLPTTRLKEADR